MLSPPGPLIRLIHRTHLFFFFINITGKIPAFRHRPFHPAAFRPLQGALSGLQKGFVSLSDNGNVNRSDPPQRIFALAAFSAALRPAAISMKLSATWDSPFPLEFPAGFVPVPDRDPSTGLYNCPAER